MTDSTFESRRQLTAGDAMSIEQLMNLGAKAASGAELTAREQDVLENFPPERYAWAVSDPAYEAGLLLGEEGENL
jgi:hypothetical protein